MKDREQEITALFGKEGNDSEVLKELTRQHRHESRDWTYVRKDGTTLPVQLVVTATTNERGQINGFLGIATDITIRKEVEDARHKYAILESKSKEMEQFAYIASHDLREPLLGIQSYISLIMEEIHADFDKELRGYLNNITAAASHMDILLKGLLDYSLLSSVTKPGPADMNKYMQDVMEMLEPLINESGAFIEVGELPVLVTCRPEMKQVFYHLLKNALTFRRSGVHARVRISAVKKNNGWLFSFTDNGMGIAPHQVEKVFVIFQRLHNRDEYPGTGIGLAHCKRIIELQGGTIWVEPGPEGGSSFCFSLAES